MRLESVFETKEFNVATFIPLGSSGYWQYMTAAGDEIVQSMQLPAYTHTEYIVVGSTNPTFPYLPPMPGVLVPPL